MTFKETFTEWLREDERLVDGDTLDILSMADWFRLIYDQRKAYPDQIKYKTRWLFEYIEFGEWFLEHVNKKSETEK